MIEPSSDITSGSTWCWRDNHCLPCHSATLTTTGVNAHLDQQNSTQQTNQTIVKSTNNRAKPGSKQTNHFQTEQNLGLTTKIPALQCRCCCTAFTTAATTVCHSKQCGSKVDRYNVLKFPLKKRPSILHDLFFFQCCQTATSWASRAQPNETPTANSQASHSTYCQVSILPFTFSMTYTTIILKFSKSTKGWKPCFHDRNYFCHQANNFSHH